MAIRIWCFVAGHRWTRIRYPDADTDDAYFRQCRRCKREDHRDHALVPGAMALGFWGQT
jgi:hypothetical protein